MKKIILIFFILNIAFCAEFDDFEDEYKKTEISDPFIKYNKIMTNFNDFIYAKIFTNFTKGYDFVMPNIAQEGIYNAFYNIKFPMRFINNVLQGKFAQASSEVGRFLINSTIGFAGFFDIATAMNIKKYDEDFGQTLGFWGIKSGAPIVYPFLGQSNLRDSFGLVGDYYAQPINYINNPWYLPTTLNLYDKLNELSLDPDSYVNFTRDSVDLYLSLIHISEPTRPY